MRFWLVLGTAPVMGCSDYNLGNDPGSDADPGSDSAVDPPTEPVAVAGDDLAAEPLEELVLDAAASYDPDGLAITAVRWTLVTAPAGSRSEISSLDELQVTYFVDLAGEYVVDLTVQNADGVWDSTPDRTVITAAPRDGFYVELSWDADNDLDLHLLNGTTFLFGDGDCSFCNKTPSWGDAGTEDDPSLDWDAIFGFGPETITIDDPGPGVFHVAVHYYGEKGFDQCKDACATSLATVNIYLAGELEATFERSLSAQGEVWNVADIDGPTSEITRVDTLDHTRRTTCR